MKSSLPESHVWADKYQNPLLVVNHLACAEMKDWASCED